MNWKCEEFIVTICHTKGKATEPIRTKLFDRTAIFTSAA